MFLNGPMFSGAVVVFVPFAKIPSGNVALLGN